MGLTETQRRQLFADFGVDKTIHHWNHALVREQLAALDKRAFRAEQPDTARAMADAEPDKKLRSETEGLTEEAFLQRDDLSGRLPSDGFLAEGQSEAVELTQGKLRAPKSGKPGLIYEQVDDHGTVISRTRYGAHGKPEYRDDLSGRPHYDKKPSRYLDQHRHSFVYNDEGQPIGETVSSIPN